MHMSSLRLLVWCDHLRPDWSQLLVPIALCKNTSKRGTWVSWSPGFMKRCPSPNFAAFVVEFELIIFKFPYEMASSLVPDLFEMQAKSPAMKRDLSETWTRGHALLLCLAAGTKHPCPPLPRLG